MHDCDVVIVGGGAAGLSAALVLGRCRRSVLICDDGHPRNESSHHVHCLLGNEGLAPAELIAEGRRELRAYESVAFFETKVLSIMNRDNHFNVACEGGRTAAARKILLTTGLEDHLPEIHGIKELYGRSVHHCPYCDGFENRDKPIAVYGQGDKGAKFALMLKQWSADIVLCTDGLTDISAALQSRLTRHGVLVCMDKIAALEGDEAGRLQRIRFQNRKVLDRSALFFTTQCSQRSNLAEMLGCQRDEKGGIIIRADTGESSVPGVYIAGDASRDVLLIVVGMAEGAKAAMAINRAFLKEDGLG
jgi:thioredoxin reductase